MPAHAAPTQRAVLADAHADLGQIEHLAREMPDVVPVIKIALATLAHQWHVIDDLLRHTDLRKMPARMALLPARLATRRTPQTLWRRLGETIRGRRPRRVAGVLSQAALEIGELCPELSDLRPQALDHTGLLNNQRGELIIRRPTRVHITQFAAQQPTPTPPEQSHYQALLR